MLKKRNIPICIILSIFTCGLYLLYWYVKVTDEVNEVCEYPDTSGFMSLIFAILTCGLYTVYWGWKIGRKLEYARHVRGIPTGHMNILFLLLNIFALDLITVALVQDELNRYNPAW